MKVHPYFQHAEEAFSLLPEAIQRLRLVQEAFGQNGEDFLAIELRTMAERLAEIEKLMQTGPQG